MKRETRKMREERERREQRKNKRIILIGFALGIIALTVYITVSLIISNNVSDVMFKTIKNGILLGIFVDIITTFFLFGISNNNKRIP